MLDDDLDSWIRRVLMISLSVTASSAFSSVSSEAFTPNTQC